MTTQIVPVSRIVTALREANITEQVLSNLKKHLSIKVTGVEDKENYELARRARIECKSLRVLATKIAKAGREDAIAEQKAWITEEKRVVGEIESVELYLEAQERIVDEAKERAEADLKEKLEKARIESERIAREKIEKRINSLVAVGVFRTLQDLFAMPDSDFDTLLKTSTVAFEEKKAREKKEADDRKVELDRLEAQRKEQDKKDKEQRDAQAKIDAEKRAIELERVKKEAEERGRKEAEEKARRDKEIADAEAKCVSEEKKRKEAEAKKEIERLEALKPDKEKLAKYGQELLSVKAPSLDTEEAINTMADVAEMLDEVINRLTE
jgi:hypothetical protein